MNQVAAARMLLRAELRRGVRGHLTVVALLIGVATALTLAAVIGRLATDPWERTWRATGAADLTVYGADAAALRTALAPLKGAITASSGPIESGFGGLRAAGRHVAVRLDARPARPGRPGRAAVVEGAVADRGTGTVMLERSFARRLGVKPGDHVTLDTPAGSRRVGVSGLAVIADQEPYPFGQPGVAFGSPALLDAVVPGHGRRFTGVALRLRDRAAAPALAALISRRGEAAAGGVRGRERFSAASWQSQRAKVSERLESPRVALMLLSALLMLCAAPVVATLVSERILARARELALLRAAGVTPAALVALTGTLFGVLGAAGGALGLAAGTLVGPLVVGASEELVAAPGAVGPAPAAAVAVVVGTGLLAAVAAALPTWLLSRRPVALALVEAAGGGRRRPSRLARAARAARLPTAAVLGAGEAFARRPRALLTVLALALSIAALVGAVAMETEIGAQPVESAFTGPGGERFDVVSTTDAEAERMRAIVYPGAAALLALALANLVAVLALALREGRRDTAILRAVGLTPREAALTVTSREIALAGVALPPGIALGLGLWKLGTALAGDGANDATMPSALALLLVGLAAVAACALVTTPLARAAGRLPLGPVLRQD